MALVLGLLVLAACDSGSRRVPAAVPDGHGPRRGAAATSGDADRLAGELLLAAGAVQRAPQRTTLRLSDQLPAREIEAAALDHLRSVGFGAGTGPDLAGSLRIRRLAKAKTAPPDLNGNGSNLDDTLAAEAARVLAHAGSGQPRFGAQVLFPWRRAGVEPGQPLLPADYPHPATWQTARLGEAEVQLADVGAAMRARALAAGRLLSLGRAGLAGATRAEGQLGLLLVQQILSAEETIFGAWFTSGGPLGGLADPRGYHPSNGLTWLPALVGVTFDPRLPTAPDSYRRLDVASDLLALAAMIEAAAELSWVAGPANPSQPLQAVFRGAPFEPPGPGKPPPPVLNWQQDIGPLITFRCGGCHLGFPTGGYQIDTYQMALAGSPRTRKRGLRMVVPGDHEASFMYRILVGPPPPFQQMPLGSSLPPAEIQRIADWIDAGGLEFPPAPPQPPDPGADLARVCFLDLAAMHLDRGSGGLHHRHEGDGTSNVATAVATGRALSALRALAAVLPELEYEGLRPIDVLSMSAAFASHRLVDMDGWVRPDVALGAGPGPASDPELASQAALTAGLLAAREALGNDHPAAEAAVRAAVRLLAGFRDPATGRFHARPGFPFVRYTPSSLADLLAALRLAAGAGVAGAADALADLLDELRPVLRFSEWAGNGELLGDGLADTDRDGVPEPSAAGGAFGRLPLLAGELLVGDAAAAAPAPPAATWSEHVRPMLLGKCGDCHCNGNEQGGYRLDTIRLAATPGQSGGQLPMLVPGDPEGSFLYRKLVDRLPPLGQQMPLSRTPLDDRARGMVRLWIQAGADGR